MKNAQDIMTTPVITVTSSVDIKDLARLLTSKSISGVPVVDDSGLLLGIVTETDLLFTEKPLHIPTFFTLLDSVLFFENPFKMDKELKSKTADFEQRKLIMSEQKRVEASKELTALENEIAKYRSQKFGVNGELFKSQEEVMKPVQNRVFTVIKEVAEDEELDFVFDRSGDILFLYAKEEYDITNAVLEKLK